MIVLLASWLWRLGLPATVVAIGLGLYALHRLCLRLEERGLLYYRKRSGGGIGSVLQPLDRMARPSVEHIEHVREEGQLARKTESGDDDATPEIGTHGDGSP